MLQILALIFFIVISFSGTDSLSNHCVTDRVYGDSQSTVWLLYHTKIHYNNWSLNQIFLCLNEPVIGVVRRHPCLWEPQDGVPDWQKFPSEPPDGVAKALNQKK